MVAYRSPQQQLFDEIFLISEELEKEIGFKTYDYLPEHNYNLPFVFIGEQFNQDRETKTNVFGSVQQTINIYGKQTQRRLVAEIAGKLNHDIRKIKNTDNFYISVDNITGQTFFDNSSNTTFSRHIMEIDFTFN